MIITPFIGSNINKLYEIVLREHGTHSKDSDRKMYRATKCVFPTHCCSRAITAKGTPEHSNVQLYTAGNASFDR